MLALFIQAADTIPPVASLGVGGGIALFMFHFYRQDRKASEARTDQILRDFRSIIESNTAAMTSLREAIRERERE